MGRVAEAVQVDGNAPETGSTELTPRAFGLRCTPSQLGDSVGAGCKVAGATKRDGKVVATSTGISAGLAEVSAVRRAD